MENEMLSCSQVDSAITVIDELKSVVYQLSCKYYCYDYRIMIFYNTDSYSILDRMLSGTSIDEVRSIIIDFIDYYQVEDDDVKTVRDILGRLTDIIGISFDM